jgi:hypothetical protein
VTPLLHAIVPHGATRMALLEPNATMTNTYYQTLDIHNSTELATKIWLDQRQVEARQSLRRAG